MNQATLTTSQVCTFRLGHALCGIEVSEIQEVLRFQAVTAVPLAPCEVTGLINLRGRIVTAIDLRKRLGLPERDPEARPMNVVLRRDEGGVSFLVDSIGDVVDVSATESEPVPATVDERFGVHVKGVYEVEHELLLVLDSASVAAPQGEHTGEASDEGRGQRDA